MRLLTLNLHCFAEENIVGNQNLITDFIFKNDVDVVFLQEVAQNANKSILSGSTKIDNYGVAIIKNLVNLGQSYHYYYETSNKAFDDLDEGLAIISKYKLFNKEHFYVSRETSYNNWSCRKIVKASIKLNDDIIDLVSVHFGWSDGIEKFENQFDKLLNKLIRSNTIYIAGDFNVPEDSKEYQYIRHNGFIDLYFNDNKKYFSDPTHLPNIDVKKEVKRIDYIFSNIEHKTIQRKIVFKNEMVSDHYGVYIEIEKVKK